MLLYTKLIKYVCSYVYVNINISAENISLKSSIDSRKSSINSMKSSINSMKSSNNSMKSSNNSLHTQVNHFLQHVKEKFSRVLIPVEEVTKLELIGKGICFSYICMYTVATLQVGQFTSKSITHLKLLVDVHTYV